MSTATITIHDPRWAELSASDGVKALAAAALWYYKPGYRYDPRFKHGLWNGKVSLLDGDYFPTGLTARLSDSLQQSGVEISITPGEPPHLARYGYLWNPDPPLRPYQDDAVAHCLAHGRGIVQMATGAGKTEVIARLIQQYDTRALVIVTTKDLLHQTAARLAARIPNVNPAIVGDGFAEFGPVTVALFQTLAQNLPDVKDELRQVKLLIADECHHVPCDTLSRVMNYVPAPYRFGFSATPETGDEREHGPFLELEAATGPVIFRYTNRNAVDDGYLIEPTVFVVSYTTPAPLDDRRKDWAGIYREGIVENDARNRAVAELAAVASLEWGPTLVLVKEIEHGESLLRRIDAPAAFLHGKLGSVARGDLLRAFRDGDFPCLVATGLLDEGVDVPAISAVVLATGGKADHKMLQRIGRGMRKGGQDKLVVIDFADDAHPILAYHSRRRQTLYQREGWTIERIAG